MTSVSLPTRLTLSLAADPAVLRPGTPLIGSGSGSGGSATTGTVTGTGSGAGNAATGASLRRLHLSYGRHRRRRSLSRFRGSFSLGFGRAQFDSVERRLFFYDRPLHRLHRGLDRLHRLNRRFHNFGGARGRRRQSRRTILALTGAAGVVRPAGLILLCRRTSKSSCSSKATRSSRPFMALSRALSSSTSLCSLVNGPPTAIGPRRGS